MAQQMQSVAVGWELYEKTGSALVLGFIGLARALPVILFALPGGQLADRFSRKRIILLCQAVQFFCALGLFALSYFQQPYYLFYVVLALSATAKAFSNPASSSLMPNLIPAQTFSNAAVWNTGSFQAATVIGPALGGMLIAFAHGAYWVYGLSAAFFLGYLVLISRISNPVSASNISHKNPNPEERGLRSVIAGIRFVRENRVILAALTLDLFAVLFGGATTLLPVYAKDILKVGAAGLGWMQAAPSVGAIFCALTLAHLPPIRRAGPLLLMVVTGFGIATIGFGVSKIFWLSLLMLLLAGGLDNVSMVIRASLVQLRTPDYMRGRVSAVNSIFISSSNEIGGFESGIAAAWLGPIIAVAGGGLATILVVAWASWAFPEIRRLDTLEVQETLSEEQVHVV